MNTPAWFKPYYDRLGSMALAIVLLVLLAIASVIGTVLLQNQSQADYLAQFGPLWYWTFRSLSLFDMYHSLWFLTLLGFLMASVGACLVRNTPRMLREMRISKIAIEDKSLQRFHHLKTWELEKTTLADAQGHIEEQLRDWEIRSTEKDGRTYLRADKGRLNKWGYILVHAAILIILMGGWISVHFGYRGVMNVVEGGRENSISFLKGPKTIDKTLPFSVRCDKFYIDFYPTGMPKTFRSTLSIFDHGKEVIHKRDIEVNHPLYYKGWRIYQASFGDGGSGIQMKLFHLNDGSVQTINTSVYQTYRDPKTGVSLEITNFHPFNVENMANPGEPKQFKDLGPAIEFIMRGPGLKPVKIKSFMNPFEMKGRNVGSLMMVSLTGQKGDYQPYSLGLDFNSPTDWKLLQAFGKHLMQQNGGGDSQQANMVAFREALHDVFGNQLPKNFQHMAMRVLQGMNNLSKVPWPFIPILSGYHQVYYSGLELARDPGMNVVWIGSAILVIGLCIMFYLPHRKLWLVLEPTAEKLRLTVGGMSNRNKLGFEQEFHRILSNLEQVLLHQQQQQGGNS
jgi:cytochrome c biogenesis protein